MRKLIIPVGIPGCGKSTFASNILGDFYRVSSDRIRESFVANGMLTAINDMSRNDEVFSLYHENIRDYLAIDRCVYADATNLRDFARARLCQIAAERDAECHLIVFTNLSVAINRNAKRSPDRIVPPNAMVSMLEQYEKALRDIPNERYDSVTYIENVQ